MRLDHGRIRWVLSRNTSDERLHFARQHIRSVHLMGLWVGPLFIERLKFSRKIKEIHHQA